VWQVVSELGPFGAAHSSSYGIFSMRNAIHLPHPARLAILGRLGDGTGGLLVMDPITGVLAEPLVRLGYPVVQATAIPTPTEDFIKGILILDDKARVHVYPAAAKPIAKLLAKSTYLYTVKPSNAQVSII